VKDATAQSESTPDSPVQPSPARWSSRVSGTRHPGVLKSGGRPKPIWMLEAMCTRASVVRRVKRKCPYLCFEYFEFDPVAVVDGEAAFRDASDWKAGHRAADPRVPMIVVPDRHRPVSIARAVAVCQCQPG